MYIPKSINSENDRLYIGRIKEVKPILRRIYCEGHCVAVGTNSIQELRLSLNLRILESDARIIGLKILSCKIFQLFTITWTFTFTIIALSILLNLLILYYFSNRLILNSRSFVLAFVVLKLLTVFKNFLVLYLTWVLFDSVRFLS